MFRASSILSRTLAATRASSAATFAVHNRFLQAAHYSSSSRHPIVRLLQWYEFYRKPPPVLYQVQSFPPGELVKVFLDYHDIPYKVVGMAPDRKIDISEFPMLIVDGEELHGTSAIIDRLRQKFPLKEKTDSTSADLEEIEWRGWAEVYLFFVLQPNMFQTFSEALESMDYVIGGSKPNLTDMAVFGILRPVRYMKCGKDMVEHTRIGEWYTRMENAVGKSSMIEASTPFF